MGRIRKTSQELKDKGAFDKDPKRGVARKHEPQPDGPIGQPPYYFDASHRAIWREIVGECPRGVLTRADRKVLELACRLTSKMRIIPGRMPTWLTFLGDALLDLGLDEREILRMKEAIHSSIGCSSQELTLLTNCLTRMGMTPADRSRVQVEPEKENNPFDDVLEALTGKSPSKSIQ
jgi:phage terminase small subunit